MNTRLCKSCGQEKRIEEFPYHKDKPLGHAYTCRACYRERDRLRDKRPDRIKKSKEWLQSESGKALYKERREQNKYREKVYLILKRFLGRGVIKREPCSICGDANSKAHHPDYSKPLEVIWLCQKHHSEVHRKESPFPYQ